MTENTYEPKKKSRLPLIIAIAAIVVIAVVAVVIAVSKTSEPSVNVETNSPLGIVIEGITNTAEAQAKAQEKTLLYDVTDGGSIEFVLDSDEMIAELLGTSLPDPSISAKIYSDVGNQQLGFEAAFEIADVRVIDAMLVLNEEALTVSSDSILGDEVLGIGFSGIAENFDSSVFGPNGSYSLGASYAELKSLIGPVLDASALEALDAKYESVINDFLNMIVGSLETNALIEENAASLNFSGETVATTAVSVKLDENGMPAFVKDVLTYIKENEGMRGLLQEVFALYESMGMLGEMGLGNTTTEVMTELDENIDDMLADLDSLSEEMGAGYLNFVFHISEKGKYFVGLEMQLVDEDYASQIAFLFGPSPADINEYSIKIVEDGEDFYAVSFVVNEDSNDAYKAELLMTEDSEEQAKLAISYDKKAGTYLVNMFDGDGEILAVNGRIIEDSKRTTFFIDTMTAEGEQMTIDSKLILVRDDKVEETEYTDILLLTEEEFGVLMGETIGSLMGLMFMMQ